MPRQGYSARDHPTFHLSTDLTTTIVSHCYPHCDSLFFYNHSDAISASPHSHPMSCILSNLISQYNNDSQGWPEWLPNKTRTPTSTGKPHTLHPLSWQSHFPPIFVFHDNLQRCTESGDQLPARDHPAIRLCTDITCTIVSTVFSTFPLCFSTNIAMSFLSHCCVALWAVFSQT